MWRRALTVLGIAGIVIAGLWWVELAYSPVHPHGDNYHGYHAGYEESPGNDLAHIIGVVFGTIVDWFWTITDTIERHHDAWLVLETFGLAAFTFTLWRATNRLWGTSQIHADHMERSVKVAQRAAEAARDSADALPILERAYVFFDIELERSFSETLGITTIKTLRAVTSAFELVNHGKTPAIIKEIRFDIFFIDNKSYLPEYPVSIIDFDVVIPGGGVFPYPTERPSIIQPQEGFKNVRTFTPYVIKRDIAMSDGDAIMRGEMFILTLGKVIYFDVFNRKHKTAVCRIYDGREGTFAEHGDRKYNHRT